jgi:hypothetical protein
MYRIFVHLCALVAEMVYLLLAQAATCQLPSLRYYKIGSGVTKARSMGTRTRCREAHRRNNPGLLTNTSVHPIPTRAHLTAAESLPQWTEIKALGHVKRTKKRDAAWQPRSPWRQTKREISPSKFTRRNHEPNQGGIDGSWEIWFRRGEVERKALRFWPTAGQPRKKAQREPQAPSLPPRP